MDERTKNSLTDAFDAAIAETATEEFLRLSRGRDAAEVAKKIHGSLDSLYNGLQSGDMPEYDEWDALFYLLWYQPFHINLAYNLASMQLKRYANQIQESGGLEVYDFGCGALAMQFGLALAISHTPGADQFAPSLTVTSSDVSKPMLLIGRKLWDKFKRKITIGGYQGISRVQKVCSALKSTYDSGWTETPTWVCYSSLSKHDSMFKGNQWLTIMHTAYEDIHTEVTEVLNEWVSKENPSCIFVTAHPQSMQWAYSPKDSSYKRCRIIIGKEAFAFQGTLEETTAFRKGIFKKYFMNATNELPDANIDFARKYLTNLPTGWVTHSSFEPSCIIYTRM